MTGKDTLLLKYQPYLSLTLFSFVTKKMRNCRRNILILSTATETQMFSRNPRNKRDCGIWFTVVVQSQRTRRTFINTGRECEVDVTHDFKRTLGTPFLRHFLPHDSLSQAFHCHTTGKDACFASISSPH